MTDRVAIYDTTLRDGTQGEGHLALGRGQARDRAPAGRARRRLRRGRLAGLEPEGRRVLRAVPERALQHARLRRSGARGRAGSAPRTMPQLRLLLDAARRPSRSSPRAWDFHVDDVLKTTLEENLAMIADSVRYLKENGREVVLDAEHFFDGYRANREYALDALRAAAERGRRLARPLRHERRLAPRQIAEAVGAPSAPSSSRRSASTRTTTASSRSRTRSPRSARARRQVQGTSTATASAAATRTSARSSPTSCSSSASSATAASSRPADGALALRRRGRATCRRTSGCRTSARTRSRTRAASTSTRSRPTRATYEHVEPGAVGNERHILISELSGRNNVLERARALGLELDGRRRDGGRRAREGARARGLPLRGRRGVVRAARAPRRPPATAAPFEPVSYTVTLAARTRRQRSTAAAEVGSATRCCVRGNRPRPRERARERGPRARSRPPTHSSELRAHRLPLLEARDRGGARPVRVWTRGTAAGGRRWATVGSSTTCWTPAGSRCSTPEYAIARAGTSRAPGAASRRRQNVDERRRSCSRTAPTTRGGGDDRRYRLDADHARPRRPATVGRRTRDRARRRPLLQLRQLLRARRAPGVGVGAADQPAKGRADGQVGSVTTTRALRGAVRVDGCRRASTATACSR